MTSIQQTDIICDGCSTSLYSQVLWRTRYEQDARAGARALGWTSTSPISITTRDYCPSCKGRE